MVATRDQWISDGVSHTHERFFMTRSFLVKNIIYRKYFSWGCHFSYKENRVFTTYFVSLYNNYKEFSWQIHFCSSTKKIVFTTHIVLVFTSQTIGLINPEISKTEVHNVPPNHKGECHTLCTLDMRYRLIYTRWINIVNPIIPSKTRWWVRFGWAIMMCAFCITTAQRGGETEGQYTDRQQDRQTD